MGRGDTKSGPKLGTVTVTIAISTMLASCAAPEQQPLSPVADPNAPMRVSTVRVSTASPDPVGQLFNDGPRQVMTYSVNTDPLSVLFRDPAFIVKLSPTLEAEPVRLATMPTNAASPAVTKPAEGATAPLTIVASTVSAQTVAQNGQSVTEPRKNEPLTEPITSRPSDATPSSQISPREAVAASTALTGTTAAPESVSEPTLSTEKNTTSSANTPGATRLPVAVAAATSAASPSVPAKPPILNTVETSEPVVLNGLKQKTAGWPIATKPSNVFGAKGPDGTAWRGLVFKSPANTPVKAIDPGTVVFAQPLRGYGNLIIIDHGKNYTSIYGYNEALTKKVGESVRKGETVALVGDTGPLADEALYFEIRKVSLPIDPTIYLATNP